MRNLFEAARVEEFKAAHRALEARQRTAVGQDESSAGPAHCCSAIGMAEGEISPPRILIGD
jgi:hypothetical protein